MNLAEQPAQMEKALEEQQLPTTVTEVLEQITDAARSILERLQNGEVVLPKETVGIHGPDVDQHLIAALVVGVAKIIAETNQIVLALSSGQEKGPVAGSGQDSPFGQELSKRANDLLGRSNVGFFG